MFDSLWKIAFDCSTTFYSSYWKMIADMVLLHCAQQKINLT